VIRWRAGVVEAVGEQWPGAIEVTVRVAEGAGPLRALAYPRLVGHPEPGDRVLLNTTAVEAGLGTGGYALVAALPDRLPADPSEPGHLVKARYAPLQVQVAGADEQGSPYHKLLRDADSIDGMPVVVGDLHSALPAVLAGLRAERAGARVAYVMTDGGALALWFSRTVATLTTLGWLAGTVTVGQAYGGDLETVTLHTGLLAARLVLRADVTVITQGPGNLGTGTRWGFSGVAAGEAVNAVAALGGRPVAALRVSDADPRDRHRGVSHHSRTAYGTVALAAADVAVPRLSGPLGEAVRADVACFAGRHRVIEVDIDGLDNSLSACPARLCTMGRGLDADRGYFLAQAAAGRHAGRLLAGTARKGWVS
jgi:hypothetical protein